MEKTISPLLVDKILLPTNLSNFGHEKIVGTCDLAKCENCTASPLVLKALAHIEPRHLSDHWEPQDVTLRTMLAKLHDISVEQVFLVRGGMGGIRYAFEIFTKEGSRVGLLKPDFPFWWDAQRARTKVLWLESGEYPFEHDVKEIERFVCTQDIPFVIFSNPNVATGAKKSADEIEKLLKAAPNTFFAVDEADAIETDSAALLTTRHDNVLIIRSFSKFYGLSGLRIGYNVVPPKFSEHFRRFIDFLEVTSFGIIAATAVLGDYNFQKETQERVREGLRLIQEACRGSLYKVVPGSSCFACYLWTDESVEDPFTTLARHGVKLAKAEIFGLDRGGRINLSDPSLIRAAAEIIRRTAPR